MLLNSLDLVFCLSSTLVLTTGALYASNNRFLVISFSVFNFLYCVLLEGTAFVTCTLTITRTISVWFPFYMIKKRTICCMLVGYFVYLVGRGGLYLYVYHSDNHPAFTQVAEMYDALGLISVTTMVICVTVATIASIIKLSKTSRKDLGWHRITSMKREATKTVMILSGFFLVFNIMFVVMLSLQVAGCDPGNGCMSRMVYELCMQGIPLNSAINPLVYFSRNEQMFQYLKDVVKKIFCMGKSSCECFSMFSLIAYFKTQM